MKIDTVDLQTCYTIGQINILNDRRNKIQEHVLRQSLTNSVNKKIIWSLTPRFGKSYLTNLFFKVSNEKLSGQHLVIAPQIGILDQWKKDVSVDNVIYVTVKTASTKAFIKKYENTIFISIIYDEADEGISSANALIYPKVLALNSIYKFALSGSFSNQNINFLKERDFDYMFKINSDEGVLMKILPQHEIINIPVILSGKEKEKYYLYYKKIEFFLSPFKKLFPDNNYAEYVINCCRYVDVPYKIIFTENNETKEIVKSGKQWCEYFSEVFKWEKYVLYNKKKNYNLYREYINTLIDECDSKISKIEEIIKKHSDEKGIIFVQKSEFSNKLGNIKNVLPYHSRLAKTVITENLNSFRNSTNKVLCSIAMTNRGFTETSISYCIRAGYNSKQNTFEQQLARCLTFDEVGNEPKIYNLYIEDFIYNDEYILSKEKIKLLKSQKNKIVTWGENNEKINM